MRSSSCRGTGSASGSSADTTTRPIHGAKPATGNHGAKVVTLTTDFGEGSPYVAAMKGVLLSKSPSVTVVDVTHSVPAFDFHAGSFLLWAGTRDFPRDSVHVAVVDPGVGTERRRLAFVTSAGSFYVGPDNGLFSLVASRLGVAETVELPLPEGASATFEGRDVFAPAAAALASDASLEDIGAPAVDPPTVLRLAERRVVWIDNFGNLVTDVEPPVRALRVAGHEITLAARTFGEAPAGQPFCYTGSLGLVEIGLREGRADLALGIERGALVEIVPL